MSNPPTTPPGLNSQEIASELNNLLQVIAGTSDALENIWEGQTDAALYFRMLRESVARAAEVTTDLVEQSGRLQGKVILPPEFNRRIPLTPQKPAPAPAAAKQRIMLVDDEKMLLILTSEILQEAGFDVVTAQSGFECLDHFRVQ
ncbi:MAG TPA: hypothetical protein VGC85_09770, partial [Chthoniobacterales bacterium]